jgi:hypothetical protein
MQMDVLAESGVATMTCQDFLNWHAPAPAMPFGAC